MIEFEVPDCSLAPAAGSGRIAFMSAYWGAAEMALNRQLPGNALTFDGAGRGADSKRRADEDAIKTIEYFLIMRHHDLCSLLFDCK